MLRGSKVYIVGSNPKYKLHIDGIECIQMISIKESYL